MNPDAHPNLQDRFGHRQISGEACHSLNPQRLISLAVRFCGQWQRFSPFPRLHEDGKLVSVETDFLFRCEAWPQVAAHRRNRSENTHVRLSPQLRRAPPQCWFNSFSWHKGHAEGSAIKILLVRLNQWVSNVIIRIDHQ